MGFIYNRTIAISRPAKETGVGFQSGYAGDLEAAETPVAKGIPASIQARARQGHGAVGLPGEGTETEWRIMIPKRALALGKVIQRDIVTDDMGERYQVTANYFDSLGFNLISIKLQA